MNYDGTDPDDGEQTYDQECWKYERRFYLNPYMFLMYKDGDTLICSFKKILN